MFHAVPVEAKTIPQWDPPIPSVADERLPLDVTFSVLASQIKSLFVTWVET
ncbi:hypothetical protein [Lysobacter antibioticus]|uniref:hypothetical protein n=1 Tax=Lysobacter antibioticus TaxID=84531 RepID=UPI001651A82A|nr:hypothetical protein [Lysobacter antibioticus]